MSLMLLPQQSIENLSCVYAMTENPEVHVPYCVT